MNSKAKKTVKIILILLVVLICGALAIYGASVGLFSYLDSTVEPTKSDLVVTAMGEFTLQPKNIIDMVGGKMVRPTQNIHINLLI